MVRNDYVDAMLAAATVDVYVFVIACGTFRVRAIVYLAHKQGAK